MGASTAGYILVKNSGTETGDKVQKMGINAFFGPLDKGSSKPSFCYPKQRDALVEEVRQMERSLEDGYVAETRRLKVKADLKMKKKRLDEIKGQEAEARKLFKANADACMKRREELAEILHEAMPSYQDVKKKKVNPQRVYDMEKRGLKKGPALGPLKVEYQILSHLAEEEPNTSYLQKDQ